MKTTANFRTRKGSRRTYEIACVAWFDLLGYGRMLRESKFNPSSPAARTAVERLRIFHDQLEIHSFKYLPVLALNDGAVIFRDLSLRARSVTFDFVTRCIKLHRQVNKTEQKLGFPGARMFIASGARMRRTTVQQNEDQKKESILERVRAGITSPEEAVNEAYKARRSFGIAAELQANFAFTKAYLADEGGSEAGFPGPFCYIDLALFEKEHPSWIGFRRKISWSVEGMSAESGELERLNRKHANKERHIGILDAKGVAERLGVNFE